MSAIYIIFDVLNPYTDIKSGLILMTAIPELKIYISVKILLDLKLMFPNKHVINSRGNI
jgi:hypothetical protein